MKYVFIDIDGTLYSPSTNSTPQSAIDAIAKARKNGHKVFVCTGRALAECRNYLNYDVDGFIFASGAMIYAEKKCIYDEPIDCDTVSYLKDQMNAMKMGYAFEGACGAYCNEIGYECALTYFAGTSNDRNQQIQNASDNCFFEEKHWHELEKIYKVCVYKPHEASFQTLIDKIPPHYLLTQTVEDPHGWDVGEITTRHINKATGIEKVLEYYGASFADTIAIGDSPNDLPMFEKCEIAIAMGNAFDNVKEKADFVTTDILDDGIKNALAYAKLI